MHAEINEERPRALALVEIRREDVATLPLLLPMVRGSDRRCLLFCDDLWFERDDTSFKSLKAVLDGGIEGRPANVVLYATSNRRHLMPREMIDNERSTAVNPAEAVEKQSRCRSGSACGSAFTTSTRALSRRSCAVMPCGIGPNCRRTARSRGQ